MRREKRSANRLKSLEPVKHIKLLFSIFRKIFNNFPIGLIIDFINFRMIKEGDKKTKRFTIYWLKSLESIASYNCLYFEDFSTILLWV